MATSVQPLSEKKTIIRSVFADNLEFEMHILNHLIDKFPIVSMDTEFPGIIFHHENIGTVRRLTPEDNYRKLKANVDALKIVQIGLTFSDENGNLPDLGTENSFVWEFNFRDFDIVHDLHAPYSTDMLKRQGVDFAVNRARGIDSKQFAELIFGSGIVCNEDVSWTTFNGAYDFGYFMKILSQRNLPESLPEFLRYVKVYFGERVYDVKHLMRFCGSLHGGLEQVSNDLKVVRVTGESHQAGSDSVLTMATFRKMKDIYFSELGVEKYANVLYGLEVYET